MTNPPSMEKVWHLRTVYHYNTTDPSFSKRTTMVLHAPSQYQITINKALVEYKGTQPPGAQKANPHGNAKRVIHFDNYFCINV